MGLKGRPRKPSAVLEMNGSFAHNPSRRRERANEPKTEKLFSFPPPDRFLIQEPATGYQTAARRLQEWEELARQAPELGLRSRGTVITLCILKAEIWSLPVGSKLLPRLADQENRLRVELGLTEVSRSKVNAGSNTNSGSGSALAGLAREGRERTRA
jgi:hypothetical protein